MSTSDDLRSAADAWEWLQQFFQRSPKGSDTSDVAVQGRNGALFSLACRLQSQGKADDEIEFAIRAANRNDNIELHENFANGPLSDRDVSTILRSALKHPKGALFGDLTKNGRPRATLPNTKIAIRLLGLQCRYDLFTMRYTIDGHELESLVGEVSDPALLRLRELIYEKFSFDPPTTAVQDAARTLANHARFHPIRDYLDGLRWDGEPRLDQWLTNYAAVTTTPYTRAVGAIVLIAAVRRVRQPGCKFDELVVLEGEQGTNKSTGLQVLAVRPEWFSDNVSLDLRGKEVIEALSGVWIVEISELKGMRHGDVERIKALLARTADRARLSYDRTVTHAPRQCIFVGTTNASQYLRDLTGNRRFWPIRGVKFNLEALRRDRDQLWAEAATREAQGESIRLPEDLWETARVEQGERTADEPWVAAIAGALEDMEGKIKASDLWAVLGVRAGHQNQAHNERLGTAMKELGWARERRRSGGGTRSYHYVRGEEPFRPITVIRNDDGTATAHYDDETAPAF
jgi:hypothetical protein